MSESIDEIMNNEHLLDIIRPLLEKEYIYWIGINVDKEIFMDQWVIIPWARYWKLVTLERLMEEFFDNRNYYLSEGYREDTLYEYEVEYGTEFDREEVEEEIRKTQDEWRKKTPREYIDSEHPGDLQRLLNGDVFFNLSKCVVNCSVYNEAIRNTELEVISEFIKHSLVEGSHSMKDLIIKERAFIVEKHGCIGVTEGVYNSIMDKLKDKKRQSRFYLLGDIYEERRVSKVTG